MRSVALSIGIDARSNSLIVSCSELMYKDIKMLIEQLEAAAKDSTRTVRVVPLKGVDPLLVQQALDAIQGRRRTFRTDTASGSSPPGGGGGAASAAVARGGFSGGGGFGGGGLPGGGGFGGGGGWVAVALAVAAGSAAAAASAVVAAASAAVAAAVGPASALTRCTAPDGGPGFFDGRVKDDPKGSSLYDPQLEPDANPGILADGRFAAPVPSDGVVPVSFEEQQPTTTQPTTTQPTPPAAGENLRGPRQQVTVEPLDIGVIVISGNQQDVAAVMEIIEILTRYAKGSEVRVEIIPLRLATPPASPTH